MLSAENQPVDIDELMAQIRAEVTAGKKRSNIQNRGLSGLYALGQPLRFGQDGNAEPFQRSGWSVAESTACWTQDETADLVFKFEKSPGDLVLSFTAAPFLGGAIESQEVTAFWDNTPVGSWSIRQASTYHTLILTQAMREAPLHCLRFHLPGSFSPLSKGLSADPRRLGLAFSDLVLQPAHAFGFQ